MNLRSLSLLFSFSATFIMCLPLVAQTPTVRPWTNTQGKSISATFQKKDGTSIILKLQDGTLSSVPLEKLSAADQDYVKKMESVELPTALGPLAWPQAISVSPASMTVTEGEQNEPLRSFTYETGNFQFVSNAPLSKTIIRNVAADFELVRSFFGQVPWGWEPRPKNGKFFKVKFTETNEDYYAVGGGENSSAGMKDDYIFFRLNSMGIERVGGRYSFDPKRRTEGEVVAMTLRLLMGEVRYYLHPWGYMGMGDILRKVAYRKDSLRFVDLTSSLKEVVKEYAEVGVIPDSERMLAFLHTYRLESGPDVLLHRRQRYFDSTLLCYFFGFLDGDGKGTAFHQYQQDIAKEATAYRVSILSDDKKPRPRKTGTWDDWALEHLDKLLAGRDDVQLKKQIVDAYAAIGVKFLK